MGNKNRAVPSKKTRRGRFFKLVRTGQQLFNVAGVEDVE
jgi:hypothetical protein